MVVLCFLCRLQKWVFFSSIFCLFVVRLVVNSWFSLRQLTISLFPFSHYWRIGLYIWYCYNLMWLYKVVPYVRLDIFELALIQILCFICYVSYVTVYLVTPLNHEIVVVVVELISHDAFWLYVFIIVIFWKLVFVFSLLMVISHMFSFSSLWVLLNFRGWLFLFPLQFIFCRINSIVSSLWWGRSHAFVMCFKSFKVHQAVVHSIAYE